MTKPAAVEPERACLPNLEANDMSTSLQIHELLLIYFFVLYRDDGILKKVTKQLTKRVTKHASDQNAQHISIHFFRQLLTTNTFVMTFNRSG